MFVAVIDGFTQVKLTIFGQWASLNIYAVCPPVWDTKKQQKQQILKPFFSRHLTTVRSKLYINYQLDALIIIYS